MAKSKGGRPSKFKGEETCKIAFKLCSILGATDKDLALFFEVDEDTINEWKKKYPEFSESLKESKALADAKVEQSLFKRACGYEHEAVHFSTYKGEVTETKYTERYPPDPTACIFWLKNRQKERWRDRQEHDLGKDTVDKLQAVINFGSKPTP